MVDSLHENSEINNRKEKKQRRKDFKKTRDEIGITECIRSRSGYGYRETPQVRVFRNIVNSIDINSDAVRC